MSQKEPPLNYRKARYKKIKNVMEACYIIKSSLTNQVTITNKLFLYESKIHKALKKYKAKPKLNKKI